MPPVSKQPLIGLNWISFNRLHMAGEGSETGNVRMKCGKKMAMTAKVFKFPHKHSKVRKTINSGVANAQANYSG